MKIKTNKKRNSVANIIEQIIKQLKINPFIRENEREALLENDTLKTRLAVQPIYVRNNRR